jgi:hypothetical protein
MEIIEVNPCEHRAYLKSFKKGKNGIVEFFFECLVPVLRGVDLLRFFGYVSLPEKLFRN